MDMRCAGRRDVSDPELAVVVAGLQGRPRRSVDERRARTGPFELRADQPALPPAEAERDREQHQE